MKMFLGLAAFLGLTAMQAPPAAQPAAALSLWRLDCGEFLIKDFGAFFSDTFAYPLGQSKEITSSCYLIRNGDRYMLWDTGLTAGLIGNPVEDAAQRIELKTSIADQLKRIGVTPEQIEFVGISHYHMDHLGQAPSFPEAALAIGAADIEHLKSRPDDYKDELAALRPWLEGGSRLIAATGDIDFFRDGRVIMLKMPGHTPGHNALLVKLASGNVLLTGDLYHFSEQVPIKGVPPFNYNRADTLASMDRFDAIARNLNAKVIIQHEPDDIAKLSSFPEAAE